MLYHPRPGLYRTGEPGKFSQKNTPRPLFSYAGNFYTNCLSTRLDRGSSNRRREGRSFIRLPGSPYNNAL